jgi:hypothetical protein
VRRTARRFRGENRERKLFFKSYGSFRPAVFLILQDPIHCAQYQSHGGEGGDGGAGVTLASRMTNMRLIASNAIRTTVRTWMMLLSLIGTLEPRGDRHQGASVGSAF